jgi:hypothetical protein
MYQERMQKIFKVQTSHVLQLFVKTFKNLVS